MRPFVRLSLNIVATITITLALARAFGSIPFAPWATTALVRFAAFFGAYGDEQVEDVYLLASLALSLVLAAVVVWGTNRLLRRSAG